MSQLSIGYQLHEADEESFVDIVRAHRASIAEVYFAWPGHPSGRSPIGMDGGGLDPEAMARFEADLVALRGLGIKLDILFNANCYGAEGQSRALEAEVVRVLREAERIAGGADIVTTTSPAIAHIVGRTFPHIDRRASVNMRIGTVEGLQYVAPLFESFHVQRDFNRDLPRLDALQAWATGHGKRLILLANSGCLRHCSGQTFHDNLVAHEADVSQTDNLPDFLAYTCWNFLRERTHWPSILAATWVRPEDLHHYADRFAVIKLATRLHARPHAVIRAYAQGRYAGNLLDLLEPGYSPLLAPWVIDNARFPPAWFARSAALASQTGLDPYFQEVLEQVLVKLDV